MLQSKCFSPSCVETIILDDSVRDESPGRGIKKQSLQSEIHALSKMPKEAGASLWPQEDRVMEAGSGCSPDTGFLHLAWDFLTFCYDPCVLQ